MNTLDIYHLGLINYREALDLQFLMLEKRISNEINDSLLVLEHPPTITIGRGGDRSNLLISDKYLKDKNIEFYEINRGGDITFHGPGQIVCYPIINLNNHTKDVHKYLRDLEGIIIDTLSEYGIEGRRVEGLTGVWVKRSKIASIGVGIKRWVTYHGLAVNVNTDLNFFDLIVPCGINNIRMTSIKEWNNLNQDIDINTVTDTVISKFLEKYGYTDTSTKNRFPGFEENTGQL